MIDRSSKKLRIMRAPTVTFGPPGGGGTTATGTAVMAGTAPNLSVASISMTNWGSGYTTPPTVKFSWRI